MLVGAVPGVDDRHGGDLGGDVRRAGERMAHHDHVDIVGDDADRVFQGLALGLAGVPVVGESDDAGAEAGDGRLEREAGPGGGFEEQAGDDFPVEEVLLAVGFEFAGDFEDVEDLFFREVLDGNQVLGHIFHL